jgi:hypothetical protein
MEFQNHLLDKLRQVFLLLDEAAAPLLFCLSFLEAKADV